MVDGSSNRKLHITYVVKFLSNLIFFCLNCVTLPSSPTRDIVRLYQLSNASYKKERPILAGVGW